MLRRGKQGNKRPRHYKINRLNLPVGKPAIIYLSSMSVAVRGSGASHPI